MHHVLVTGAAGFAGSTLTERLIREGHFVLGLDFVGPLQADSLKSVRDNKRFHHQWKALQDIDASDLEGIDTVVHFAAQADVPLGFSSPRWTVEQNVMGTICLLEAVRKYGLVERFILAASGTEFGHPMYLPIDENHPLTPHNPYAFSKAAEEMAGWSWHHSYGIPMTVMSNGACLGKNMRREIFIFKWLYNILRDKPVVLEGGEQTRDLTYIDDLVDAWMLAIKAPDGVIDGQKFQISYGEEHSVEELLEYCFEACGKRTEVIRKSYRPGEKGLRELFTNAKAMGSLGYRPKVSPLQGIRMTKDWIEREIL